MGRLFYAGADVRVEPSGESEWTSERRAKYLIRADAAFPLSVDPNVWARIPSDGANPLPWISVPEVRARALSPAASRPACLTVFAVAVESDAELTELRQRLGVQEALTPDPAWSFAGFDIAEDVTGTSGLSNCGYGDELPELRATWMPRLNEHGLFMALEDAFAFRSLTDARVPEHAPFAVYGVWLVGRL